jgi:hypothetical protein
MAAAGLMAALAAPIAHASASAAPSVNDATPSTAASEAARELASELAVQVSEVTAARLTARVTCTATGAVHFSPPITAVRQKITVTGSGPVDCTDSQLGPVSGTWMIDTARTDLTASCSDGGGTGTVTITWANGEKTTISGSKPSFFAVGMMTAPSVTDGKYQGLSAGGAPIGLDVPALMTQCSTPLGVRDVAVNVAGWLGDAN